MQFQYGIIMYVKAGVTIAGSWLMLNNIAVNYQPAIHFKSLYSKAYEKELTNIAGKQFLAWKKSCGFKMYFSFQKSCMWKSLSFWHIIPLCNVLSMNSWNFTFSGVHVSATLSSDPFCKSKEEKMLAWQALLFCKVSTHLTEGWPTTFQLCKIKEGSKVHIFCFLQKSCLT